MWGSWSAYADSSIYLEPGVLQRVWLFRLGLALEVVAAHMVAVGRVAVLSALSAADHGVAEGGWRPFGPTGDRGTDVSLVCAGNVVVLPRTELCLLHAAVTRMENAN